MHFQNSGPSDITAEMLAGLGLDYLATLLAEQVRKDHELSTRLRPILAARAKTINAKTTHIHDSGSMIGASPVMRRIQRTIQKVAGTDAPVLITGESGTGKELAAQSIHNASPRAKRPFVAINCGALPESLIASELFGHEKGAFTGASQRRIGRIQAAHTGTLFLDEIGDLPIDLQAHLLRFLQEGTIDPLGGSNPVNVDVRVIAATNVSLREAVERGRFRQDLFFRLNVLTIEMPPLRTRTGDLEKLALTFIHRFATEADKVIDGVSPNAMAAILAHDWPGNVRELMATMRRAVVMADGVTIECDDLGIVPPEADAPPLLDNARRETEANLIRHALDMHHNNITRTARHLGVSRMTLYRMLDRHGIHR